MESCDEQLPSGVMKDCPVFELTTDSEECKLENPLPPAITHEDVEGPMQGLPNGLQISSGPEPASKPAAQGPAAAEPKVDKPSKNTPQTPAAPLAPTQAISPKSDAHADAPEINQKNKVDAPADDNKPPPETTRTVITSTQHVAAAITPPPPNSPHELKAGEHVLSTSYSTKGNTVYEIIKIVKEIRVVREQAANSGHQHVRRHLRHHHKRLHHM